MPGPRVETRGYFLASLTGLTLGAPLISGPNPGLFSVAPLGLQEQARVAGDGFFPPLLFPAGGGGRRRRPGVDLNPAILGKGCRFVQPHSGLGRWGCPESRVHRLRGRPPVRPGTRCRAGDGAWNMSPFLSGAGPAPSPNVQTGTRCHAAGESSPEGTEENSPGFQPGD